MAIERRVQRLLRQARRGDEPSQLKQFLTDQLEAWPEPFPWLAKDLEQEHGCAFEIAEQLAVLGHPAVPALLKALRRHSSPSAREAAAGALALLGLADTLPALTNALRHDPSADVRRLAAHGLWLMADARAVPALRQALDAETDSEARSVIIQALGAKLVGALRRDKSREVRAAAATALGRLGDARAVKALGGRPAR